MTLPDSMSAVLDAINNPKVPPQFVNVRTESNPALEMHIGDGSAISAQRKLSDDLVRRESADIQPAPLSTVKPYKPG